MNERQHRRIYFSLLYLGVIFVGFAWVYGRFLHFEGVVFLLPKSSERLAIAPEGKGVALGAAQRGVEPELLLLDNPRTLSVLRRDQRYDGFLLPGALRLDEVEVLQEHPPWDVLYLAGVDGERKVTVAPGDTVTLDGASLQVESIGPWSGLIRDPRGGPMVLLRVTGSGAPERMIFAEPGNLYRGGDGVAVAFAWFPNEAEARAAIPTSLDGIPGARWGVREGTAVQWMENFTPGSGIVLRDGTQVSVLALERAAGLLTLRVVEGGKARREVVRANESHEGPRLFEDPAAAGCVVFIHGWREDLVLVTTLRRDGPLETTLAKPGETIALPCGEQTLRVEQVLGQAIAAPGGEVRAARVRSSEQDYTLREGAAERIGNARARYQAEVVPPDARYHLSLLGENGAVETSFALEGDQSFRMGSWVYSVARENPFAPQGVAIRAERRPGGPAHWAGVVLFVCGSVGLVVARFRPRD